MASQVISLVEVPLLLFAAYLFVNQAGGQFSSPSTPDTTPLYLTLFVYAAALGCFAALIVIVAAYILTTPDQKAELLALGNLFAALAGGIGTAGDVLLHNIWNWTMPSALAPTANGVISQLILAIAGGAFVALLPAIAILLLRRQPKALATS